MGDITFDKVDKLLTVSVAAYNVEDTLGEALDSFLDPEVRRLTQVLIVDDGSSDGTARIAQEYVERYPETFCLISKENGGWGSTLNAAMEAASGRYFKQLDGDDLYMAENLPRFLRLLAATDADMIWSAFTVWEAKTGGTIYVESRFREFTGICSYRLEEDLSMSGPHFRTLDMKEMGNLVPAMHSVAVRTQLLRDAGIRLTEHCFYTDLEFVLKVYAHCRTFTYFELPVYMYRVNSDGQSMSISGIRKHYRDHQKVLLNCLEYWTEHVHDLHRREALRLRLERACTMQYMFYYALECNNQQRQEFMEFDRYMQEHYPEFIRDAEGGNRLRILRKLGFRGYRILGPQNTRQDQRLRRHIFEKT